MRFWKQVRLAGAVVCIVAAATNTLILSCIGLLIMAVGIIGQVDDAERRLDELEKGDHDEEA